MRTHAPKSTLPAHRGMPSGQTGATLVVGLVLLLVLTVLGVSGMRTATMEVTMAGNTQFQQDAFQAAETGIDISITRPNLTSAADVVPLTALGDGSYSTRAIKNCVTTTPVPDGAYSAGAYQAWHFDIVATGSGPRNAVSTHNQSFYIVGPAAGTCP